MAGTCNSLSPHVIGNTVIELSRNGRTGAAFSVRISTKSHGVTTASTATCNKKEGPSCIYVGPIETASKETLEALYRQARDAYYSGEPLIVDDMFDRVELKLRWYGSKSVVKYPRCSIRRQSTYADAEEDLSQVLALASIWILIFGIGSSICFVPMIYTVALAYQDAFSKGISYGSQASVSGFLAMANVILFMAVGALIGYPVASASVRVLQGLWWNDLVALKGACPNCGEEVFAFVTSDQTKTSPHRADCHVCESLLEFRTKVEQSGSRLGRQWVCGRIYLLSRRNRRQRYL
ncbi:PGR5-like protein 1B, chloroplastic [Mangifera indica]|uniref:PGR5-like protein 1B, chloroplastic n=1 Tax=Mangifera indica TaxID=29780 RepID=UPI001CFA4205|nr:PGR5-like protein 1B, chloroplastic [Mangifera indica]XP_044483112.1 PGR5-like protein 1B, chloroplastic [Mangifera indica]